MQFNADKCEVLRITNKRNPTICNYRVHDQHLQTVKQAKYLDATISSDLSCVWPGLCSNYTILDPCNGQCYERPQHEIPRSTVVRECTHVFLFPEYHKDLEQTATAGCLSTQFRGLQAAAPEIHRVNNKVAF